MKELKEIKKLSNSHNIILVNLMNKWLKNFFLISAIAEMIGKLILKKNNFFNLWFKHENNFYRDFN
jgi:hypothetical protein